MWQGKGGGVSALCPPHQKSYLYVACQMLLNRTICKCNGFKHEVCDHAAEHT